MELGMREYGGIAAVIGMLGIWGGVSMQIPDLTMIASFFFVGGGVLVYVTLDPWYCSMCGQKLGRIIKPSECGRCGSNRMTKRDPGVGDAVRVR